METVMENLVIAGKKRRQCSRFLGRRLVHRRSRIGARFVLIRR